MYVNVLLSTKEFLEISDVFANYTVFRRLSGISAIPTRFYDKFDEKITAYWLNFKNILNFSNFNHRCHRDTTENKPFQIEQNFVTGRYWPSFSECPARNPCFKASPQTAQNGARALRGDNLRQRQNRKSQLCTLQRKKNEMLR